MRGGGGDGVVRMTHPSVGQAAAVLSIGMSQSIKSYNNKTLRGGTSNSYKLANSQYSDKHEHTHTKHHHHQRHLHCLLPIMHHHLKVDHAVELVLGAEPRFRSEMTAAWLLPAPRGLAPGTLHVHHVRQLVLPATATNAVRVVPITTA